MKGQIPTVHVQRGGGREHRSQFAIARDTAAAVEGHGCDRQAGEEHTGLHPSEMVEGKTEK